MAVGFDAWFYTPADRGYLAESVPFYAGGASLVPTAGRHEMVRLKVPQAGLCTNIVLSVTTIGGTLTTGQNFAALYHANGTLVAQSADQTTNWSGTTGAKSAALSGGPYYLAVGEYYATFWYNGTTAPTLARQTNSVAAWVNGLSAAPNFLFATNAASLTTAAPATLGTQTAGGISWWVALS